MNGKIKILPIILMIPAVVVCFSACGRPDVRADEPIAAFLIGKIGSTDDAESYTAMLLLANIALTDSDINRIRHMYMSETNSLRRLHMAYILAARTQEKQYVDDFIELYPSGKEQVLVWRAFREKSDLIGVSSPLQDRLAMYAMFDDEALAKLIEGYEYADGADREIIASHITSVYEHHPLKVINQLKKSGTDLSRYGIE